MTTKPCPFCGDLRAASIEEVIMEFDPPNLLRAVCKCCGAEGPPATTRTAAAICWDERRAPGDSQGFRDLANRLAGNPPTS